MMLIHSCREERQRFWRNAICLLRARNASIASSQTWYVARAGSSQARSLTKLVSQAVFDVNKGHGLMLVEIAPDLTVDDVIAATACKFDVSPNLKEMGQA